MIYEISILSKFNEVNLRHTKNIIVNNSEHEKNNTNEML